MLKKLRLKFILVNMTIVTAMLCAIFCVVLHTTQKDLETQSIQQLHLLAGLPNGQNRPGRPPEPFRQSSFTLRLSPDGALLSADTDYYEPEELERLAAEADEPLGTLKQENLRYLRVTEPKGDTRLIFVDTSAERAMLSALIRSSLLISIGSFFAFLVISTFLARWAVKPVEQAWEQQRQFVADASHELKTPLTVITTNAELLQEPDCTEASRLQFSGSILTMAGRMRTLTESLLNLARVDSGVPASVFQRLNLSQLLSDTVLPFEPVCFEKGLTLETVIEPELYVKGSAAHLQQAAEILLDNAQKYACGEGQITVRLSRQGHLCHYSVENPGAPIPPEEQKQIFKRFYRMDPSRTHDGSFGLGLSIAEEIVRLHKGKIWADSLDGVNRFTIQLPLG